MTIYSDIEKEIIILADVMEIAIDSVNNYRTKLSGDLDDAEISLKSEDSQKILALNLLELISPANLVNGRGKSQNSYLDLLSSLPNTGSEATMGKKSESFVDAVQEFSNWINGFISIERIWLPSIDQELDMEISRKDLVYISANVIKHRVTRLDSVYKRIRRVLKENSIEIDNENSMIIIEEMQEWLYKDIFNYQIGRITELLNNLKFGITDYLSEEIMRISAGKTRNISNEAVRHFYYELMNCTKTCPKYFPKFELSERLKKRY